MIKAAKYYYYTLACLSAFSLLGCGSDAETKTQPNKIDVEKPVSDWQLMWSDEFDGNVIDTQYWTHEVNCDGGGNNEKQCYTDSIDNAYIDDGVLHIVALPATEGAEKPYTSARLNTKYKADFKYGRFEMRAKLPSGQGSWPAFWMLPTDEFYGGWPKSGEIDILEAVNLKAVDADGNIENKVHGTLHYGKDWPDNVHSGKSYTLPEEVNPADDFHTYAIEWQEGEIRWYVDDYLYQTQRRSTLRYNSKGEAVGLAHRGWFAEYFGQGSGELTTHWDNAPFDQDFHLLLNLAVGGDWPENVNNLGIDASAFANGQHFEIDYVRVYQCSTNLETGKGCETVRGGYDSLDDALVEGKAPIPSAPSSGSAKKLVIFDDAVNPNWPAWDCCGGSMPSVVDDEMQGEVMEFSVGAAPTVNGFISRDENITDPNGKATPFDASPLGKDGTLSFKMKVLSLPNKADAQWLLKVESAGAATYAEVSLADSVEGNAPIAGEWQTYTFSLQALADLNLDLSAIDVVMVFPAWGEGEGAVYRIADLMISLELTVFTDEENSRWPMWDCCGGSTPTIEIDDEAHGAVAEFSIGASPTVMGFISRPDNITDPKATPQPFDSSPIISNGVIQFDMKVLSMPVNANAEWKFKVESVDAATNVEVNLNESIEGNSPVLEQWQTYTFNLADLANGGLDVSAIDALMIFPAWGSGEDAVYRVDNVKIYDPSMSSGFDGFVLFTDQVLEHWSIWDCCGSTPPLIANDDTEHGVTAEYTVGAAPTVMGLLADDGSYLDVSSLLQTGVVQFELKVLTPPNDANAIWKFKIEGGDATSEVELDLTDSQEGQAPVVGEWQTYTFSLEDLYDAGLDISQIDVIMVFPAWGTGEGAVFRLDNVMIYDPASVPLSKEKSVLYRFYNADLGAKSNVNNIGKRFPARAWHQGMQSYLKIKDDAMS